MSSVAVIDYGMGNLHSVAKALERAAHGQTEVIVTGDRRTILGCDRVVLPGVGAIRDCMAELIRLGLDTTIHEVAASRPLLGVCVGMQALMQTSDENGGTQCLRILPGKVRGFTEQLDAIGGEAARLKVPHMGWNRVVPTRTHPLWAGIESGTRFYFVHSYYVEPGDPSLSAATSEYGLPFTCAVAHNNLFAVQFHPEKSQHAGLRLYANFLAWDGTL